MLDQLYKDFSEKMLPIIAQGLTITKDYFFDLFGRYVKYLLINDIIWAIIGLILIIIGSIILYKGIKQEKDRLSYDFPTKIVMGAILLSFGIPIILISIDYTIMDIYIPEVRIYQELKGLKQ